MSKGAVFQGDLVYRSIIMSVSERQAALIARSRHMWIASQAVADLPARQVKAVDRLLLNASGS